MVTETEILEFGMKNARDDVIRHRSILFQATIVGSKGDYAIVGGPRSLTQESKIAWFAAVRRIIRERQGIAVMITAPVSRAVYTPEGQKEFERLHSEGITPTIDAGVKLGLCKKVNAILAALQTPLQTTVYLQDYEHVGGKAVFGEFSRTDSNEGATFSGLLTDLFEGPASSKPN
jgi:hypothetical protein